MSDKDQVRKRINTFIDPKNYESDLTSDVLKLIKSVYDDFRLQGVPTAKAAEQTRIEIQSWKYLFRVRKSEFADLLQQIEGICSKTDFSRLETPPLDLVEGESNKIKVYYRGKKFQLQVPKGYQIQPEHLERMRKTVVELYFDNIDDFGDRTLKATMTVQRLETLPRYDLWFE
ncbi:MAG: hypothetical protein H6686_05455 [Fibrobacteria bacterium]|nr:hypothetical protein [Fibrobacteria bacterium]